MPIPHASKTIYVKDLLLRFSNTPTLTLAKKAYKKHPEFFPNLEAARRCFNYYRGLNGDRSRDEIVDTRFLKQPAYNTNPFALPESKSVKRGVWKLPKSIKKVLLLSDLHFPYHDLEAIETALNYGKEEKVDAIFINGDLLDFYQISFHEKDPRLTSIPDELQMGRDFFKSLRKHFPDAIIYYIPGNHEYRLQRYLRVKAPELLDIEEFRLDVLLRVAESKIEYIEHGTKCYFGKLLVEHGDKIKGAGGVNPARTLFLKLKRHALCGHFHRTTECTEKVYDAEVVVCYSVGCLCELEPGYMEVNNHNHGFAIIEMTGDNFSVYNKKIIKGKVY